MKRKAKILFIHKASTTEYLLLLGRRVSSNESFWWIPGGSVEANETDFEAGLRELEEELFLTSDFIDALSVYENTKQLPQCIEYLTPQAKNIIFLVPILLSKGIALPAIKDEFEEMAWINLNALPTNMSREFSYVQTPLEALIRLL